MLDRLFNQASELEEQGEVDDEVRAHFTQYLYVRTSGYLEFSIRKIMKEYMKIKVTPPEVERYVARNLDRWAPGPRRSEILKLLGIFSEEWKLEVGNQIEQQMGHSLTSLVNNRNKIAHGEVEDLSNLSLSDLKDHFENAKKVVEIIDRQCLPTE